MKIDAPTQPTSSKPSTRQKPNHRSHPSRTTPSNLQSTGQSEARRAMIAQRAYELYLLRGAQDGHDVEDWLQAEREV